MTNARPKLTGVFSEALPPKVEAAAAPSLRPDRQGKAAVPFWTTKTAKKQLRLLAADLETSQQALLTEALNDLFRKNHKPPIA